MSTYSLDGNLNLPGPVREALTALTTAGFFDDGLLVGSWAMLFYRELFGVQYVLHTDDIDFALKTAVATKKDRVDLEVALAICGFDPVTDILSGLQKFLSGTFEIEFLIHRKGARDQIVTIGKYNVTAQPLPFLDLLFTEPLEVRASQFRVRIPSPEALFLHKLIIAQRRKKESKQEKDLEQCATLAPHLDQDKLAALASGYRMGKETVRNILKSCGHIDYPPNFLPVTSTPKK